MRRPATRLLLATVALALVGGGLATPSQAAGTPMGEEFTDATPPQTPGLPDLDVIDPVRFSYDDAVVEHYQVPTRFNPPTCMPDVSMATCPHSIWVDVIRPDTTEKVPAIMMSSPYYNTLGRGFREQCKLPTDPTISFPTSPGAPGLSNCADDQVGFPEWYDEYFVPRGYAYVAMDLYGTRNSSGCQTYGDRDEIFTTVDVIDFLAEQEWSNGKIGMTGGSYDGTIANGAAVEAPISGKHPDALAAIIPIRSIDAWYDYHWFNGVQSQGHASTAALFTAALAALDTPNSGPLNDPLYVEHLAERKACIATEGAVTDLGYAQTYSDADDPFWDERDFHKDAAGIRAATFVIHGLKDFNVKPHNAGWMWAALPADLPKRLLLLETDHTDPRCPTTEVCQASGHNWEFPRPDEFVEANHRWWLQFLKGVEAGALETKVQVQDARTGKLKESAQWPLPGTRQTLAFGAEGALTPSPATDEAGTANWGDGPLGTGTPGSISFETAPFAAETRLSGQIGFDLKLTMDGPDTTVGVSIEALDEEGGESQLSYGWLRTYYRDSVTSGPERPVPSGGSFTTPGEEIAASFASMHLDTVVPAGGALRFTLSNAAGGTIASNTGGVVRLATGADGSTLTLPIAAAETPPTRPRPVTPPPRPRPPAPRPPAPLPATGGSTSPVIALLAAAALGVGVQVRRRRA
jgi:X-Pro dipeptidyl-peptidase